MGGRGGAPMRAQSNTAAPAAAPAAQAPMESRIVTAYKDLRDRFDNDWVLLTFVREQAGGTRAEQDAAFRQLVKERKIRMIPEENQQTLRPVDWDAGLNLGGEQKHLMGIIR